MLYRRPCRSAGHVRVTLSAISSARPRSARDGASRRRYPTPFPFLRVHSKRIDRLISGYVLSLLISFGTCSLKAYALDPVWFFSAGPQRRSLERSACNDAGTTVSCLHSFSLLSRSFCRHVLAEVAASRTKPCPTTGASK